MATPLQPTGLIKPDMNDLVDDFVANIGTSMEIVNAFYPIGSIYQSTVNTDPSTFLGGIWTPLEGAMLIGASSEFPAGTTGGSKTHTLVANEMPGHAHSDLIWEDGGRLSLNDTPTPNPGYALSWKTGAGIGIIKTGSTGGGRAHNNMPPYRSVYMWERTA